jgi:hypothetical protein
MPIPNLKTLLNLNSNCIYSRHGRDTDYVRIIVLLAVVSFGCIKVPSQQEQQYTEPVVSEATKRNDVLLVERPSVSDPEFPVRERLQTTLSGVIRRHLVAGRLLSDR